jgi:hypothetical protein
MYDHQLFDLGHGLTAACHTEDTRYGFRHLAVLFRDGTQIAQAKACYYNRTWESYRYESVLLKLIDDAHLIPAEHDAARASVLNYKEPNPFSALGGLLALADVITPDQADANSLKKIALSTVTGIEFPDDWDTLPEEEKARRLGKAKHVLLEIDLGDEPVKP